MRNIVAVLLAVVLGGCAISNVSYDYDKNVNFSNLKTYQFSPTSPHRRADASFVRHIESAIEADLQAKGFVRTDNAPDFTVSLHRSVEMRRDFTGGGYPYSQHRGYWYHNQLDMYQYKEEMIYLTVYSGVNRDVIWKSTRVSTVRPSPTSEDRQDKANLTAGQLLENFPPRILKS